jgi:hypothetical protein
MFVFSGVMVSSGNKLMFLVLARLDVL